MWRAWLVDSDGRKIRCGVIPSKYKIEEELQRSSLADLDHESRRSSTSARRSFFRRRKHTRSSSRDSKEIASFSDSSLQPGSAEVLGLSTSVYVQVWFQDVNSLMYQKGLLISMILLSGSYQSTSCFLCSSREV